MQTIGKNSAGLAVGLFFGLAHLAWTILVALNWAKPLMEWILHLHFVEMPLTFQPFAFGTALVLVAVTFVVGYIAGWVLAALWNALVK